MGIILIFMIVAALFFCLVATLVSVSLVAGALYLAHEHPAWRWAAAVALAAYAVALLYRFWKPSWSDADVPDGLKDTWNAAGAVIRYWPLPGAVIALCGAVAVPLVRW